MSPKRHFTLAINKFDLLCLNVLSQDFLMKAFDLFLTFSNLGQYFNVRTGLYLKATILLKVQALNLL